MNVLKRAAVGGGSYVVNYLNPRVYDHVERQVLGALAAGDCAFAVDARDFMAMPLAAPWKPGAPLSVPASEVYAIVRSERGPWIWARNFRCKYVRLLSKGGVLSMADRDGLPLTMAQLRYQFGRTEEA